VHSIFTEKKFLLYPQPLSTKFFLWIWTSAKFVFREKNFDENTLNLQRLVRSIHKDGRSREKPVNDRIKIILTMNINETLSEDNHKIHGCNQELCNRAVHRFMHWTSAFQCYNCVSNVFCTRLSNYVIKYEINKTIDVVWWVLWK
jgi:hypothetical protein